jgi:hypothetical protein
VVPRAARRGATTLPRDAVARLVGAQRAQRARRAASAPRCHGGSDDASAAGGASAGALPPAALAAYAARPVYVLTEPITLDKLTALMVRAAAPSRPAHRLVCATARIFFVLSTLAIRRLWHTRRFRQVLGIPWARVAAWSVMMLCGYYLRDFLGVRAPRCCARTTLALADAYSRSSRGTCFCSRGLLPVRCSASSRSLAPRSWLAAPSSCLSSATVSLTWAPRAGPAAAAC